MFALPLPPDDADVAQAASDADVSSNPLRAPYVALMRGQPGILAAMDYANLPADCRTGIWGAIDDYISGGTSTHSYPGDSDWAVDPQQYYTVEVDDFGMPPSYDITLPATNPPFSLLGDGPLHNPPLIDKETYQQMQVSLTRAQAIETFGAKVAHALYHEIQGTFPWRLGSYSNENLSGLFDPNELFKQSTTSEWDLDASPAVVLRWIMDHIPQEAYDLAVVALNNPLTPFEALADIQDNLMGETRHHVNADANWMIKLKDIFYPSVHGGLTVDNEWISRNGCHSGKLMFNALARSVNIPAIGVYDWHWQGSHSAMAFPTVDRMFVHGDDCYYATNFSPFRGMNATINYTDFKTQVVPLGKYTYEAERAMCRLDVLMGLDMPHPQYVGAMRNQHNVDGFRGINYLLSFYEWAFTPGADADQLTQVYEHIKRYSEELTGFPCVDHPTDPAHSYGRIHVDAGVTDREFLITPYFHPSFKLLPEPANAYVPRRGNLQTTAREGLHTIEWPDDTPNYDPPADDVFQVDKDVTVNVGPPAYTPKANVVAVETQAPWEGAGFTLTPNPTTGTGFVLGAGWTVYEDALPGQYDLLWSDNLAGYNPPADPTEGPTELVVDTVGITFGPPTYEPE